MSESNGKLDFSSLEIIKIPVKIKDQDLWLVEASGEVAVAYQNARLSCQRISPNGYLESMGDQASANIILVSGCLFKDDNGEPAKSSVPESFVRSLPGRVFQAIYEKAMEISGLREDDEDEVSIVKEIERLSKRLGELRQAKETAKNELEDMPVG